jgi:hypothetical protein
MSDLDAAARPPAASAPITTPKVPSHTSHATTGESPSLPRLSPPRTDSDNDFGYFDGGRHCGYNTMSDRADAARPPAASATIITSKLPPPTSYATSGESPRLQRPSTFRNDTDDSVLYHVRSRHFRSSTFAVLSIILTFCRLLFMIVCSIGMSCCTCLLRDQWNQ